MSADAPPAWLRALAYVIRPLRRALLRAVAVEDVWKRMDVPAPVYQFGPGSRHDFAWYFEGESAVRVDDFGGVTGWLAECEYASDPQVFGERDVWQHPGDFERRRRGDCEDFALWAWRKLVELGYDADFVVGRVLPWNGTSRHAWVLFRRDGETYVFEPVSSGRESAVRPLAKVRDAYLPEFGVDSARRRYVFAGTLQVMKDAVPGLADPEPAPG